jgi:hypothetical protein
MELYPDMLFVGGGQDYHGPTAARDKEVVKRTAQILYELIGDCVCVATGGMPGIPDDFANAWNGKYVLGVVSSEYEAQWNDRKPAHFDTLVIPGSQEKRRLAVTQMTGIKCVLFVQGGKFSTHELKLFAERGVPIVSFTGSGGAAGGDANTAYEGWTYNVPNDDPAVCSTNPTADVDQIAYSLAMKCAREFGYRE